MSSSQTLVISDLHLGHRHGSDVLRNAKALEVLKLRLQEVDRLVLLGDLIELRHSPFKKAFGLAQPVLSSLAEVLVGKEVVIVPGNHDHRLISSWLDLQLERGEPLQLEQLFDPAECESTELVAQTLAGANVQVAYPGIYLRPDIYATHGHYVDRVITVPTLERLAAGVMSRVVGQVPTQAVPNDYEAALSPLYAWIDSVVRVSGKRGGAGSGASVKIWKQLSGSGSHTPWRTKLLGGVGLPLMVAGLNRAGIGPLKTDLNPVEFRRAGIAAMDHVVRSLGIESEYVIFGHTHRPGPLPRDIPAEWQLPKGTKLINSGSWVYENAFVMDSALESPYWPGVAISISSKGPPQVECLLQDFSPRDF